MNGNINGRWQTSGNVMKVDCGGGKTIYHQDYGYFYKEAGKTNLVQNYFGGDLSTK